MQFTLNVHLSCAHLNCGNSPKASKFWLHNAASVLGWKINDFAKWIIFHFFMIQKIFTNQRTDDYADGDNSTPEIMLIPLNHMECRLSIWKFQIL